MRTLKIASRNVFRNWHRTLVTTAAMGFAGFIMILFASLMEGLLQGSERNAVSMDLGDIQIHAPDYREDPDLYKVISDPDRILADLKKAGFHAAKRLYGFGLAASGATSAGVQLRGIDLSNESDVTQINRHVLKGKWLEESDPSGVVIGRKLARTLGVDIGDELIFVGQATDGSMANDIYTVKGILKSVGEEVDRAGLYMQDSAFRELMVLPEGAHEIAVMRPDRSTDLIAATSKVADIAPGCETLNWRELMPVIARILDLADSQMIIMVIITYTAVAMLVLNAMLMTVFERIRELGIMKAVGVKPWQIMMLVYAETFMQVLAASIIAGVSGIALSRYFEHNGIDLSSLAEGASFGGVAVDPIWRAHLTAESVAVPIVFLFIIAFLSVLYPAIKAAVIQPVRAIHHR
ncbi:MAG: ABC transporter permease [Deltaproteobacteria bacterium]|nr:ABC transporter permease [Deltaproteobacteria bacterium]